MTKVYSSLLPNMRVCFIKQVNKNLHKSGSIITCGSGAATGAESTMQPLILPIKEGSCCLNFSKINPYLFARSIQEKQF